MSAVSSNSQEVVRLLDSLSLLGERVIALSLHFRTNCAVTADVEMLVGGPAVGVCAEIFRGCEIVMSKSRDAVDEAADAAMAEINSLTSAAHRSINRSYEEALHSLGLLGVALP